MSLLTNKLDTKAPDIQRVTSLVEGYDLVLDVLRLDEVHPIVSGNKLFKLQFHIDKAIEERYSSLLTFGGYYSNHIVATAYAAQISGLKSIGVIRGERPSALTHTLKDAETYGMELQFIGSDGFRKLKRNGSSTNGDYIIPEGGYGELAAAGITAMIRSIPKIDTYTHIITPIGTGTTLAGLINAANTDQQVIGFSALKNAFSLNEEVAALVKEQQVLYTIDHDHHFGGFAKYDDTLLTFMKDVWNNEKMPTDIVYTGKTLYAISDLIHKGYFPKGSRLLMIHTGGLQGNRSLAPGSLPFL